MEGEEQSPSTPKRGAKRKVKNASSVKETTATAPSPKRRRGGYFREVISQVLQDAVAPAAAPQVGDQIYVWRLGFMYKHHGIYIGEDQVVHFHGSSPEDAEIKQTSLQEFSNGNPVYIQQYTHTFAGVCPSNKVVKRAKKMIGYFRGQYDLFTFNCEHFAVMCKTGMIGSRQIDKYEILQRTVPGFDYLKYRYNKDWKGRLNKYFNLKARQAATIVS
jgi:hypothetical protein